MLCRERPRAQPARDHHSACRHELCSHSPAKCSLKVCTMHLYHAIVCKLSQVLEESHGFLIHEPSPLPIVQDARAVRQLDVRCGRKPQLVVVLLQHDALALQRPAAVGVSLREIRPILEDAGPANWICDHLSLRVGDDVHFDRRSVIAVKSSQELPPVSSLQGTREASTC